LGLHIGPQTLRWLDPDPGTLGLKGTSRTLRDVAVVAHVVYFQGGALFGVGLVA
jgi:hypothetical protein